MSLAFLILSQRISEYHDLTRSLSRAMVDGKRTSTSAYAPKGSDPAMFARSMAVLIATGICDLRIPLDKILPVHEMQGEGDEILGEKFHKTLSTHSGYVVVTCVNMCDMAWKMHRRGNIDNQRQDALAALLQVRPKTVFLMMCGHHLHIEVCGESGWDDEMTQMLRKDEY